MINVKRLSFASAAGAENETEGATCVRAEGKLRPTSTFKSPYSTASVPSSFTESIISGMTRCSGAVSAASTALKSP